MSSLLNFREGNFKAAISELEKSNSLHNIEIVKYYNSGCRDVNELLSKLQALDHSPLCRYNLAVLLFYKEHYGGALTYLTFLYSNLEILSDYIAIKTCILLTETYIAMGLKPEAKQIIEKLETHEPFSLILKTSTKPDIIPSNFSALLLGAWIEENPEEDISYYEY